MSSKPTAAAGRRKALPTPARGTSRVNVGFAERLLSAAAGGVLLYLGMRRGTKPAATVGYSVVGGSLVFRGASGYCPLNETLGRNSVAKQLDPIEITETFTIYRPVQEVYAFWRQLENLPRFMQHLERVEQIDERHSHWEARVPGGLGTVAWDAIILTEYPNRLLVYQSLPGSAVDHAGRVTFREAPGDKGTEIQSVISYRAPVGALGQGVAKLFNPAFKQLVRSDMRRFKQIMETGEISTIEGQPSGRGHDKG
ncbi:SRPBCC family protein [Hymenobacter sp.]|jgi:uncharacterized membrane protein|uniref:SRPBCC family protein n=1 Tax=Hymenobacter sp. TaxID=1898978 RepID=UPI002ED8C34A